MAGEWGSSRVWLRGRRCSDKMLDVGGSSLRPVRTGHNRLRHSGAVLLGVLFLTAVLSVATASA